MAAVQWSNLPSDILSAIAKLLSSDIDLLRLRSICSSWRSSLPPPPRKLISFPLKVPPLLSTYEFSFCNILNGYFTLDQSTLYRLSPPSTSARAGDPSHGWLFKVSQTTNPNTFSLLETLMTGKLDYPPEKVAIKPQHLNLLDYRVSEVCRSYTIRFFRTRDSTFENLIYIFEKVIALWNYVPNCDFAELNFAVVVASPVGYDGVVRNYLVECESDLYMVSKMSTREPLMYNYLLHHRPSDEPDIDFKLVLNKFSKCKGDWDSIGDLGDVVLVLFDDVSLSVSPKDFGGSKGNRVYLTDSSFADEIGYDTSGVYHLDDGRAFALTMAEDCGKIFWPPPSWLCV